MRLSAATNHRVLSGASTGDAIQYRLIYSVCFFVFIWATLAERMFRGRPRTDAVDGKRLSLMAEVRDSAHRCTALAFGG